MTRPADEAAGAGVLCTRVKHSGGEDWFCEAKITIGDNATLAVYDRHGALVAAFAPGQWLYARPDTIGGTRS